MQPTASQHGASNQPSIRYGHASAVTPGGSLVISHGYFYDAPARMATWLSDTWQLSMTHDVRSLPIA